MKIIYHNKELWNDPKFRNTPAWSKALYFYIYDNCDPAGFWDIDMAFAQAFLNFEVPKTVDDVRTALVGDFLWQSKDNLFLIRNFINTTQKRTSLLPSQPPHVKVLEAMIKRSRDGLENVVEVVRKANPGLAFSSIEDANPNGTNQLNAVEKSKAYYTELKIEDTSLKTVPSKPLAADF